REGKRLDVKALDKAIHASHRKPALETLPDVRPQREDFPALRIISCLILSHTKYKLQQQVSKKRTKRVPVNTSKYPFTIIKGQVNPLATDFCYFKQSLSSCWSSGEDVLEALEKLLRDFAVPLAKASGEQLVKFTHERDTGWIKSPPTIGLLAVLENCEDVLGLVSRPGQRYKGEGGTEAAAICIQSCWRRYAARTPFLVHCWRRWVEGTIALPWLMHCQIRCHLATNWKHIQSSKRTIIHIPSLGSFLRLLHLRGLEILQNVQISRLCDIRGWFFSYENIEVLYISGPNTHTSSRLRHFVILTSEAADYFPVMLKRFTFCICCVYAVIHQVMEHPLQDTLRSRSHLFPPLVFQTHNMCLSTLLGTKSQRRLFKMDSEHGGCGTAYCDVFHLSCHRWALQDYHCHGRQLWNTYWIQEFQGGLPVTPDLLKPPYYPNWALLLKTFLWQAVLCSRRGPVTMLSCEDQFGGSCPLKTLGSTVPQTSVHPETLHSICPRVGKACLQHRVIGYVSVDLVAFLDHKAMEQKVWAIDLDLTYSDQLAMTQMLLKMTGRTLNCRTGSLKVPVPVREKCCEHQNASWEPLVSMCKAHSIGFNMKVKAQILLVFAFLNSFVWGVVKSTISGDLQGALVTFVQNLSVIHQEISASKMQGTTNFEELIKGIQTVEDKPLSRLCQVKSSCRHDSLKSLSEYTSLGVNVDHTEACKLTQEKQCHDQS
uniref:IQCH-like ATP-grasp domain-containing protein n=1 Tax=Mola mola TaxID=94237 RepID=A0A3Q3VNS2_MOLML